MVDKPRGKTSHDVVETVRRLVGFRQIGHLGTLDPLATGVLVLALGRATRLARFYGARRKRYTCSVRFGFATDTYDADGEALVRGRGAGARCRCDSSARRRNSSGRFSRCRRRFRRRKFTGARRTNSRENRNP